MMLQKHCGSLIALLGLCCFLFSSGCSESDVRISEKICSIYQQMQSFEDLPVNERESALVGLVQEEMPVFYDENFQFFMDVEWAKKPETMQRLLGMIENNDNYVLCDSIKDYYSID